MIVLKMRVRKLFTNKLIIKSPTFTEKKNSFSNLYGWELEKSMTALLINYLEKEKIYNSKAFFKTFPIMTPS